MSYPSSSSSDADDLPPEFQKRNAHASELYESTLHGKQLVLPSILKYKRQQQRNEARERKKLLQQQELKRKQMERFYGARSGKVDRANGFVIDEGKMWEGVPEEQRRRLMRPDFLRAATGENR